MKAEGSNKAYPAACAGIRKQSMESQGILMKTYINVGIVAILHPIMESNTMHYKSDFAHDVELFARAANSPDAEDKQLLWMSRPCGTECFYERDVYMKGSYAHTAWLYHAGNKTIAYAVEITGIQNGNVMGNLYELDSRKHAAKLERDALIPKEVTLEFEDGTESRCPYETYERMKYDLSRKHGKIRGKRLEPENEADLRSLLGAVRRERHRHDENRA